MQRIQTANFKTESEDIQYTHSLLTCYPYQVLIADKGSDTSDYQNNNGIPLKFKYLIEKRSSF